MLEVIAQHDYAGSRFLRGVAIDEAFRDPKYAQGPFARLYDLLATDAIDLNHGERLVRVGRQLSEYLVFQTMWALFKSRFGYRQRRPLAAFETQSLMAA